MPPLWAKALWPTKGWAFRRFRLAVSYTNRDSSRQPFRAAAVQDLVPLFLQRQVGDHRHQIGIAAAFPKAVDRALHLDGARIHRGQRVGHGQFAIVVAMDADRHSVRLQALARRRVMSATSSGSVPPLVSQRITTLAPAAAAAWIVRAA